METTTRPLTSKERTDLARLASASSQWTSELLSAAVAFMLLFMLGVGLARWTSGPPQGLTLGLVSVVALAGATALLVYARRGVGRVLDAERSSHAEDLAHGQAACTTYEAVDALRVEEFEDEGSAYYLKLADGRVLFLQGQYLYDYEEGEDDDGQPSPARFPCRHFRVERAARSGLLLELVPLAGPFVPSGTLPHFSDEDYRAERVPSDGDVLALDFEALRARQAS